MPRKVTQPPKAYSKHYHMGLGFHGFHRINYLEWGDVKKFHTQETLLCVHGISRTAHDFDFFAKKLCGQYRIVCPDVVGRGDSDHLESADAYNYLQYNADMNALIARLGVTEVNWVGTSMGGIIGMALASVAQSPIRRLVINDVGTIVPRKALNIIGKYIGRAGEFDSLEKAEKYMRKIHAPFGPMNDEDWKHMTKYSTRRTRDGKFVMKMDPGVGDAFRSSVPFAGMDIWDIWEKVSCPVLLIRGTESTLFSEENAQKMLTCGPETTLVEIDGVGHTPSLRSHEQVGIIKNWLANTSMAF